MTGLDLRRRQWGAVAAVTAYAVAAGAGVVALVTTGSDPAAVALLAVVAVALFVVLLARLLGGTAAIARRLASDTRLIVDANPAHRLDPVGAGDLYLLAAAVNRLADRRETAEREVAQQVEAARRELEQERNRLAALMAELTVAVIVCNTEGRILLYNDAARALIGDDSVLGLGRSVFGIVDRGLVAHAYDRLASGGEPVQGATTLQRDRLLQVRLALVRETEGTPSGFVLVLDDLTRQVRAADQREALLRRLTEATRASVASMRAAVESVLDFPDLSPEDRRRFLEIVREDADRLGGRVDAWARDSGYLGEDRVLTDIAGADLLAVLERQLEQAGLPCRVTPPPENLWVRGDGYAVSRVLVHLVTRLGEMSGLDGLALSLTSSGRHAQMDARWSGRAPASSTVDAWLSEPLGGSGTPTGRDVVDRHGGEIWAGEDVGGTAYLRLLLPLAATVQKRTVATPGSVVAAGTASRPEFYDFDLFRARTQAEDRGDRRLEDLSFTVFDTETTGLDPKGGDRVVSMGAVRVVNGRLLRHETFERLVDPGRPVPRASTAIHGITDDMLAGAPSLDDVLREFARFAADTVLVGHNVSFDLQFLQQSLDGGVTLDQPVLDTLLLDAALNPDHDDHSLEAVAERLGVSVVGRHTALGDALVTGEVLVGLLMLLRRRGITTLGQALAASRETYEARLDESLFGR